MSEENTMEYPYNLIQEAINVSRYKLPITDPMDIAPNTITNFLTRRFSERTVFILIARFKFNLSYTSIGEEVNLSGTGVRAICDKAVRVIAKEIYNGEFSVVPLSRYKALLEENAALKKKANDTTPARTVLLKDLGLGSRATNALYYGGIRDIDTLISRHGQWNSLMRLHGLGKVTFIEIESALYKHGLISESEVIFQQSLA